MGTMLDRLQEDRLRGLRGLVEWREAAAVADAGDDELAAFADYLVDEGIGTRQGLERLWDYHWALALAGLVTDRRQHAATLRALLESGGPALADAAALALKLADRSGREVARLADFQKQAAAFPLWVEECMARLEMLDRTRAPLNRERVARSRAAYERGECEDAAAVTARLERGGPVVRE